MPPTSEERWLKVLATLPTWTPPFRPTVVISPHPDDETLGAGGLVAAQAARGIPVCVIAVTDGEAAYPGVVDLGKHRKWEQEKAVQRLGADPGSMVRLAFPDSGVSGYERQLEEAIRPFVTAETFLVAPWRKDCHPDHEVCGRVAERIAADTKATLASYLFWSWHRHTAEVLRNLPLRRFDLSNAQLSAKLAALAEHKSQLEWKNHLAILPEMYLEPARRPFETFIV